MTFKTRIEEWIKNNGTKSLPYQIEYSINRGVLTVDVWRYFENLFNEEEQQARDNKHRQELYKDFKVNKTKNIKNKIYVCCQCRCEYRLTSRNHKYCGKICASCAKIRLQRERYDRGVYKDYKRPLRAYEKKCNYCGKIFNSEKYMKKYCSVECRNLGINSKKKVKL
jgi:hypothetical protein